MSDTLMWWLLTATCVLGAIYTYWSNNGSYDDGFMDAVQLHSEGRLTYDVAADTDGIKIITIEVTDED